MERSARKMTDKNKRKHPQPYDTLALAEDATRDEKTDASHPSDENVERARDWSEELKL